MIAADKGLLIKFSVLQRETLFENFNVTDVGAAQVNCELPVHEKMQLQF
jgi:hypothetical protein